MAKSKKEIKGPLRFANMLKHAETSSDFTPKQPYFKRHGKVTTTGQHGQLNRNTAIASEQ